MNDENEKMCASTAMIATADGYIDFQTFMGGVTKLLDERYAKACLIKLINYLLYENGELQDYIDGLQERGSDGSHIYHTIMRCACSYGVVDGLISADDQAEIAKIGGAVYK